MVLYYTCQKPLALCKMFSDLLVVACHFIHLSVTLLVAVIVSFAGRVFVDLALIRLAAFVRGIILFFLCCCR